MRSAKRHIHPLIWRSYIEPGDKSVWTVLNYEKRLTDSDEAHDLKRQGDPQARGSCA